MSETLDPKAGMDKAMAGMSEASKSMQTFATELTKMSKDNLDSTTKLMEKLRGAKSVEEVVSLQTSFMQQSFASYTDYTRRISEMMMKLPMEMMKQSQSALQKGAETMKRTTDQAGEQIKHVGEQSGQHQG